MSSIRPRSIAALKAQAIAMGNNTFALILAKLCDDAGLPPFVREHQYIPHRKFRLDFAWPQYKVGIECDGGTWTKGAHSTGQGIARDMQKNNLGLLEGWAVLRVVPSDLATPTTLDMVKKLIGARS